jgi:hypothetical protein
MNAMSAREPWLRALLASGLALVAGACDEIDLPKSWAIAYPRVLAQRSEVVGDETRATPAPGESLRVRVLIAGPEPIERLSYVVVACPTVRTNGELPECSAEPLIALDGVLGEDEPFTDELALELQLPDEDALQGVDELLIAGSACTDGDARGPGDPRAGECKGSDEPALTWAGNVRLARRERDHNHNPELRDEAIAFDGEVWPTAVPPDQDEGTVTVIADGEPHQIEVSLGESGRERFDGEPEELLLSHFTTAGPLERRFSVLEAGDPDDRALSVEWRSPRPPPDVKPPASAKLYFVLRDQRGGVAFARRTAAIEAK